MNNIITIDELQSNNAKFMINILKYPENSSSSQVLVALLWYSDLYTRDKTIKKLLIDQFNVDFNKFKTI